MESTAASSFAKPVPPGRARSWRRRLIRTVVILAVAYFGVIGVLLAFEYSFLFHPTKAAEVWDSPPNALVEDVNLTLEDGTAIHAWWCPVPGATETVLFCHGNAGNLSIQGNTIPNWQKRMNLSVLIFDYPGYGRSTGKPTEAGIYAAADKAYDWLVHDRKIAATSILLVGESLGCAVAVDLAHRKPHRAVVLISAFTSIPDMARDHYLWPAGWLVRNRFDNLAKMGEVSGPVFIAHGDCDTMIPFGHSQRLFAAAREPKQFFTLKGCDHNNPLPEKFHDSLRHFLGENVPQSDSN